MESKEQSVGSRYVLEEPLGHGASGTVWRGRVRGTGASVAVKVLREELAGDPDVVTRFLRERSLLMRVHHPHLVTVHDLVVEGDVLALVMELVNGPDLRTHLRRHGPMPAAEAARLMALVLDALAVTHRHGIVHRDLKPANILLRTSPAGPVPLLSDFGIARAADGTQLTRTREVLGTPQYLAPETVAGHSPTPAVDLYAAGVVLYELVSGRPPFNDPDVFALLRRHVEEAPARLPGLPEPLWRIIADCLGKDPAGRPGAADVASRLRAAAAGLAGAGTGVAVLGATATATWTGTRTGTATGTATSAGTGTAADSASWAALPGEAVLDRLLRRFRILFPPAGETAGAAAPPPLPPSPPVPPLSGGQGVPDTRRTLRETSGTLLGTGRTVSPPPETRRLGEIRRLGGAWGSTGHQQSPPPAGTSPAGRPWREPITRASGRRPVTFSAPWMPPVPAPLPEYRQKRRLLSRRRSEPAAFAPVPVRPAPPAPAPQPPAPVRRPGKRLRHQPSPPPRPEFRSPAKRPPRPKRVGRRRPPLMFRLALWVVAATLLYLYAVVGM